MKPLRNCRSPSFAGSFDEAEYVASVVHAKVLGTEHVLYAILHDGNALATRILERAGFSYEDKKDQVKIAALRRNLEERAGWTREDLKAFTPTPSYSS